METKYAVIDRNSMWGWQHSQIEPEKAEVIFIFNDFLFEKDINKWQKEGKKVIVFEHGWNSFFDYELNNQKFIADGYMALGKNTAESLARAGIPKKKILISGNPKFENLPKGENKRPIPSIIYTALHWFGERKEYNSQKLDTIIKELLPYLYNLVHIFS